METSHQQEHCLTQVAREDLNLKKNSFMCLRPIRKFWNPWSTFENLPFVQPNIHGGEGGGRQGVPFGRYVKFTPRYIIVGGEGEVSEILLDIFHNMLYRLFPVLTHVEYHKQN
jgi:hypothetical protein